jgi:peptidyl-prolyl cis-trans isomerase C
MHLKPLYLALTLAGICLTSLAYSQTPSASTATPPAQDAPKPAAATAAPATAATPAAADVVRPDPNKPIARVNGVVLSAIHMNLLREERASRGQSPEQNSDENLRDSLVNAEIMAQEASKLGLDKMIGMQAALDLNRKELLGRALVDDYMNKHPIADERIRTEYDKLKAKAGDTEYHARHILVPDEKLAQELITKLKAKKAKFEDLAKKYSKDSSGANGGDLGWMAPGNLVPEFATALVKLKKAEFTLAPVQSKFGWHIIRLEETRPIAFPEFDKVKGRLANQLAQIEIRKYVTELRAAARVEVPSPTPATAKVDAPATATATPAAAPANATK